MSRLRKAAVLAAAFDGQAHAQFYRDDRIPEDRSAIAEIAAWFDRYLGR